MYWFKAGLALKRFLAFLTLKTTLLLMTRVNMIFQYGPPTEFFETDVAFE